MSTDQVSTRLYNKKVQPLSGFKDKFLDYLLSYVEDDAENNYRDDGVFDSGVAVIPGAGNNRIDIAQAAGFRGVTGQGRTVLLSAADSRLNEVWIPPNAGIDYHVAIEQSRVEQGIEINPRTGQPEYIEFKELIGRTGTPNLVTDNGNGTLTIRVNSVTESGEDHSGRQVRVWLKARDQGGPGPLATTEAVAIETRPITFSGGNNNITTVGLFGQTTASVAINDYVIMLVGPTVRRTEDLRTTAGALYLARVTSVAAAAPITTISTADQRIIRSIGTIDTQLQQLASEGFLPGSITTGLSTSGGGGLSANVQAGSAWVDGVRYTYPLTNVPGLPDASTVYIYIDANGVLTFTTTLATAFALDALVLAKLTTAGGVVTSSVDLRRIFRHANGRWFATVGFQGDFGDINHAMGWLREAQAAGLTSRPPVELVLLGDQTYGSAQIIDVPRVTVRGSTDTRIRWGFNGIAFDIRADDVKLLDITGFFDLAGVQSSSRFAVVPSASTSHRVEIRGCRISAAFANLDTAILLDGTGNDARVIDNQITDVVNGVQVAAGFNNAQVHRNSVRTTATGGEAIYLQGGSGNAAHDNTVVGTFNVGVHSGVSADRHSIQGNWIEDVATYGIQAEGDDALIVGNMVETPDAPVAGIYASGARASIVGNKVHDYDAGWGIWAAGQTPNVSNNYITPTGATVTGGILIDDATAGAPGFVCSGNWVGGEGTLPTRVTGGIGIDAELANKGTIVGNFVSSWGDSTTGGRGINGGDQQAITGNCIERGYGYGIYLNGAECACSGNVLDDINGIAGIAVDGDKNTVVGNTVSNITATYAIRILSSANDTLCQCNNVNIAVSDIGTNTMLGASVTDNNNLI